MKTCNPVNLSLVAGLLLASLVGCSKPKPQTAAWDGRWTGFELSNPAGKCAVTIGGTQLEYRGARSDDWCRGTFVLNETVKPAQMDLAIQESPGAAGKMMFLICELNGDEMKVSGSQPGTPQRPVDFSGGGQTRVWTFTRE